MIALTVTAKGQITLRRELLRHLGVAPGQQVVVDKLGDGLIGLRAAPALGIEAFVGCLPKPATAMSVQEMNDLIASGWAANLRAL